MGIDEIALRKGKGDFALILTNLDTKEVVDVLKARTQEKLRTRLQQLSPFERAQIQEAAIDMWNPYDTVCAELLPRAVITADRFHVMQAVNRELRQLKNQQKKALPHVLKGVHYALLKNRQDLTHKQQAALERVYQVSPLVKTAHRLKECLRHIFECKSTKEKAIKRLRKWCLIAETAGPLSAVLSDVIELDGSDCQLLLSPHDQWRRRRHQQQNQTHQAPGLWISQL